MNIHVDTLEYAKMLETAGMERAHAEAIAKLQAQSVKDPIDHELVTKDDLEAGLNSLEVKLRDEIRGESAKLRQEIRSENAKLHEEIRSENAKLREEFRSGNAKLREELRSDLAAESTDRRRQVDGVMIQIRALQFGGAIAAFVISAVVLLSRLVR